MALLTMLKRSQARAGPEPRGHVGDLVEPVLGDAVEYREQAPVVDGDRLVAHFRVPWDLGPGRDVYNHDALKQKKRLGIPGGHGLPISLSGDTRVTWQIRSI